MNFNQFSSPCLFFPSPIPPNNQLQPSFPNPEILADACRQSSRAHGSRFKAVSIFFKLWSGMVVDTIFALQTFVLDFSKTCSVSCQKSKRFWNYYIIRETISLTHIPIGKAVLPNVISCTFFIFLVLLIVSLSFKWNIPSVQSLSYFLQIILNYLEVCYFSLHFYSNQTSSFLEIVYQCLHYWLCLTWRKTTKQHINWFMYNTAKNTVSFTFTGKLRDNCRI